MLLVIDIGNTHTVFALVEDSQIVLRFSIHTNAQRTWDEYYSLFRDLITAQGHTLKPRSVILSSTVPAAVFNVKQMVERYISCPLLVVGEPDCRLDLPIRVDLGTRVGPDRLVNAIAGHMLYGGDLVIVDLGTATTFDIVAQDGGYEGGVIAPGVNLSLKALSDHAAALPYIDIARPKSVIGKSTLVAMQSGIFWGYTALLEGLYTRIVQEYARPMRFVATGGLSTLFAKSVNFDIIDPDLTLKGLAYISKMNER